MWGRTWLKTVPHPRTVEGNGGLGFLDGWGNWLLTFLISKNCLPSHGVWEVEGTRQGFVVTEGFSRLSFCSPCRDLSNNQIAEMAPDAFQGLRSLNSL